MQLLRHEHHWSHCQPLLIFLSFHSNVSHILSSNKGAWYINVARNHVATPPIKTTQFDSGGPMLHQTTKPNSWLDLVVCYITIVGIPMDATTSFFWLPINILKLRVDIFDNGLIFIFSYTLLDKPLLITTRVSNNSLSAPTYVTRVTCHNLHYVDYTYQISPMHCPIYPT